MHDSTALVYVWLMSIATACTIARSSNEYEPRAR